MIAAAALVVGLAGPLPAADGLDACDARAAAAPHDLDALHCYAVAARRENRYPEAARRLRGLLERDPRNDWARLVLAAVRADQNGPDAEGLYQVAADGLAARGDARAELMARVFQAAYYRVGGRARLAEAPLARARALADVLKDPVLSARVTVAEAWASYNRGDYGRALRLLDEAQPVVLGQAPGALRATWLSARGIVCWGLGRHAEALQHYRLEAAMLGESGDRYEEAVARGNIVFMARVLGMGQEEILPLARELLVTAAAGGNRAVEARAHGYLSSLAPRPEAVEHARRFLALSRETGRTSAIVLGLQTLSLLSADEDPAEAYRLVDEAAALAAPERNLEQVARVRVVRGYVGWVAGPRRVAIADSLAALDAIEATRNLQPEAMVRAHRFSQWRRAYTILTGNLLSGRLLEPGTAPAEEDVQLAFAVTERRRARMLLDAMDGARATVPPRGPLAERRDRVLDAIAGVQRRLLATGPDAGQRARTLAELERLEVEEEGLRVELARSDAAFAALHQPRLATLADVREALGEDEALLSFQIAEGGHTPSPAFEDDGGSWLIVLSRRGTRVYPLASGVAAAVPLFVGLFERRDGSEAVPAARLGARLLDRALHDLPPEVSRLVVVPDAVLHTVPFDALRVAGDTLLGVRYEVTVVPSATLWVRFRRTVPTPSEAPVLALSDPDLPTGVAEAEASAERQWAVAVGARLGRLPHARREGRMIVRHLGGGSRVLAGPEANEDYVKRADLGRFALVHFAAHAVVDEEKPERSAILLAPGSPREDGLLQVRELVALDLRDRLVVLSACRSASGLLLRNDGFLGLAHAFFQAGAKTVVGTLWTLRDDDAERLFDGFYRRIAEGRSVGEALAGARRERIRAGAPAAAWAGVVVLGDGRAVPVPGGRPAPSPRRWPGAMALLVLAGLAALLFRARARARRPARVSG